MHPVQPFCRKISKTRIIELIKSKSKDLYRGRGWKEEKKWETGVQEGEFTGFLRLLSYKSRKHEKELYHAAQNGQSLKQCKMRTKEAAASWPNTSDSSAMRFGRKLRHFPLNA